VRNLTNLEPTVKALADVGPILDTVLALAPTFPFTQNFIDRAIRGDYINIFATMDLTVPRLKRSLFLGTRWGDPNAALVPAPGDPPHLNYTYDPLSVGVAPPPPADDPGGPPSALPGPAPAEAPLLPVSPPTARSAGPPSSIFAGPYPQGTGGG
jgi:hypothetical protein